MKSLLLTIALLAAGLLSMHAQGIGVYLGDGGYHFLRFGARPLRLTHTEGNLLCPDGTIPLADIDSCKVHATDIPTLHFTFPEHPDYKWVVDKENYIPATLDIEGGGRYPDLFGLSLQVKGRGNSSWRFPKKPMRLKFNKKTSLFGLAKAKSYVLLADYIDPSMMHNAAAHWLAREIEAPYACHTVPCHVYVNGRYAGAYTLTEKIGIGSASVDIDETKGVLLEISTEYDEPYKFRSPIYDLPVMFKDPDFDELHEDSPWLGLPLEHMERWKADFSKAEDLGRKKRGGEAYDLESLAKYFLVCNIAANNEIGFPKSVYLSKTHLGTGPKYTFGPLWDFDYAFDVAFPSEGEIQTADPECQLWVTTWMAALLRLPEFEQLYFAEFDRFYAEIYPRMREWLINYAAMIEPSARLDGQRWSEEYELSWVWRESAFDRDKHLASLLDWLDRRVIVLLKRRQCGKVW